MRRPRRSARRRRLISSRWASTVGFMCVTMSRLALSVGNPRLENFPAQMPGHFAGKGVAFADEQIGARPRSATARRSIRCRPNRRTPFRRPKSATRSMARPIDGPPPRSAAYGRARLFRRRPRFPSTLQGNRHFVPVDFGKNASIAGSSRARVPGGPAISSGRSRRLRNCASSSRNGSPPKWSPCRCDSTMPSILFKSSLSAFSAGKRGGAEIDRQRAFGRLQPEARIEASARAEGVTGADNV